MPFLNRGEVFIFAVIIGCTYASSPYISDSSSYTSVHEDFNGTVWRFHVVDPDKGDSLTIRPLDNITAQYFTIDQVSSGNDVWVNVTVKKPLDRETLGLIVKARFLITDNQHSELHYDHVIYISDVNDNLPEFQNLSSYTLEINELPCNKTTVYTNIYAFDKDSDENGRIRYSMTPKAQSPELRKLYAQTFSMDPVTGHVSLSSCLDYERTAYYQFAVMAKDSGTHLRLTSTAELVILVKDVIDESAFITG